MTNPVDVGDQLVVRGCRAVALARSTQEGKVKSVAQKAFVLCTQLRENTSTLLLRTRQCYEIFRKSYHLAPHVTNGLAVAEGILGVCSLNPLSIAYGTGKILAASLAELKAVLEYEGPGKGQLTDMIESAQYQLDLIQQLEKQKEYLIEQVETRIGIAHTKCLKMSRDMQALYNSIQREDAIFEEDFRILHEKQAHFKDTLCKAIELWKQNKTTFDQGFSAIMKSRQLMDAFVLDLRCLASSSVGSEEEDEQESKADFAKSLTTILTHLDKHLTTIQESLEEGCQLLLQHSLNQSDFDGTFIKLIEMESDIQQKTRLLQEKRQTQKHLAMVEELQRDTAQLGQQLVRCMDAIQYHHLLADLQSQFINELQSCLEDAQRASTMAVTLQDVAVGGTMGALAAVTLCATNPILMVASLPLAIPGGTLAHKGGIVTSLLRNALKSFSSSLPYSEKGYKGELCSFKFDNWSTGVKGTLCGNESRTKGLFQAQVGGSTVQFDMCIGQSQRIHILKCVEDFSKFLEEETDVLRIRECLGELISLNHEIQNAQVNIAYPGQPEDIVYLFTERDRSKINNIINSFKKKLEVQIEQLSRQQQIQ